MILTGVSLLTAAGMLMMGPAAFALSNGTGIVNSGDGVNVRSNTSSQMNIDVDQRNDANVMQRVNADVNTGHNDASGNIATNGGGTAGITSGDAGLNVGLAVEANSNEIGIAGMSQNGGDNFTDIVNTGDDSRINTSTDTRTNVNVDSRNSSFVRQNIDSHMNTGYNSANDNIGGGGEIMTGEAVANVGLEAALNQNQIGISMGNSDMGSASAMNDTIVTNTGDDLDSDTRVNTRSDIFVRSSNRMSSEQHVSSHSNSGWNDAMDNIGGNSSSLMSGNAGMNSGASVMGNLNTTFLGSMWDSFMSMFN